MVRELSKTSLFCDYYSQWIQVYKEGAVRPVTLNKYKMTLSWLKKPEFPIYLYIAGFRRQFSSPSRSKTSLWRPKISPSQTFPVDEL